ncbi:MAG: hypothetical protein ABIA93_05480 [Candidatus Woesearchaeota archaeon]
MHIVKELFDQLDSGTPRVLLDTCFVFSMLDRHEEHKLNDIDGIGITSFNAQELLLKEHSVHDSIRHSMRKWLKTKPVVLFTVPVEPGQRETEKNFVQSVDPKLLELIADPSDAVLLAAAFQCKANVLTKDRHHLYTAVLENYAKDYGVQVYKELKDLL